MKCALCSRSADDELCGRHLQAEGRLEEAYGRWVEAYGAMDWKVFLDRVITNARSGQWAKEVAQLLVGRLDAKTKA
jgi:hypothetical protein